MRKIRLLVLALVASAAVLNPSAVAASNVICDAAWRDIPPSYEGLSSPNIREYSWQGVPAWEDRAISAHRATNSQVWIQGLYLEDFVNAQADWEDNWISMGGTVKTGYGVKVGQTWTSAGYVPVFVTVGTDNNSYTKTYLNPGWSGWVGSIGLSAYNSVSSSPSIWMNLYDGDGPTQLDVRMNFAAGGDIEYRCANGVDI